MTTKTRKRDKAYNKLLAMPNFHKYTIASLIKLFIGLTLLWVMVDVWTYDFGLGVGLGNTFKRMLIWGVFSVGFGHWLLKVFGYTSKPCKNCGGDKVIKEE